MKQTRFFQIAACLVLAWAMTSLTCADQPVRPNVLWLTAEDIGPHLNCYGDSTARTPNLDDLASRGLVYEVAWSNYPVCAPARTTIVTGMYAASLGAGNMRSRVPLPNGFQLFPQFLRQAGYYCTNNSKEDYNVIKPGRVWDESSPTAHYRKRPPDQPFFAVFNYTGTHESKIRKRPHQAVIDPASVKLKTYWPDSPDVRRDWAQYYDNLQALDDWIGERLDELKRSGLADETIVLFFGDHGSGMPRHKRFAGDSGMHVPLLIHVPETLPQLAPADYVPGGRSNRLVGFIDLAPSMLSLAGIQAPEYLAGRAVMGPFAKSAPEYLFGYRERMDERPDLSRSIRDRQFVYIRNYMPFLPAGQSVHYQMQTPTTAIWIRWFMDGKLNQIQSRFWKPHPPEELYDLLADPDETRNLVGNPAYATHLQRFRQVHHRQVLESQDLGFIPEGDLFELYRQGAPGQIVDTDDFPLEEILELANRAATVDSNVAALLTGLQSSTAAFRYWTAIGLRTRGALLDRGQLDLLSDSLPELPPAAAIVVADVLASFGDDEQAKQAFDVLLHFANFENANAYYAVQALNVIDRTTDRMHSVAPATLEQLKQLPVNDGLKRGGGYLKRLRQDIMSRNTAIEPSAIPADGIRKYRPADGIPERMDDMACVPGHGRVSGVVRSSE